MVNIDSPWFVGKAEALCVESPVFDVVLGEIDDVRPVNLVAWFAGACQM